MSFSFFLLLIFCLKNLSVAQTTAPQKIMLKVNLGGGPVADFFGEEQVLDMEGFDKTRTRELIQNTDQPDVFQSQRFSRNEGFTMRIPVPDGIYSVTLLFAETYKKACQPGARVFDISIGTPVSGVTKIFENFDVFQAAGCLSAHEKRLERVPSKEGIVVHLTRKYQHPSLSGFIVEGIPLPRGDGTEYKALPGQNLPAMDGGGNLESGMQDSEESSASVRAPFQEELQEDNGSSMAAPPTMAMPQQAGPDMTQQYARGNEEPATLSQMAPGNTAMVMQQPQMPTNEASGAMHGPVSYPGQPGLQ